MAATSRLPDALTTAPAPIPAVVVVEEITTSAEPPIELPDGEVLVLPPSSSSQLKLPPTSMLWVDVDAMTAVPADQDTFWAGPNLRAL